MALKFGIEAVCCFMECIRLYNPTKSKVFVAKVFWLIKSIVTCGHKLTAPLEDLLKKTCHTAPPVHYLFW